MRVLMARRLALSGFHIFPLMPNSKRPAIRDWPERASTDPDYAAGWWSDGVDYNIGIHTRGMCVIDLDPKHGGPENWAALVQQRKMLGDDTPSTLQVRTPSGGFHLYFWLPPGVEVPNSVHKLGKGIDVRGRNGYVVGPGSTIDGKTYEIVDDEA
jgi:Bifunctional DNA primase/polymerase, N-terminal